MDIVDKLDAFMLSPERNKWVWDVALKIYVRKAFHVIDKSPYKTLDVANIEQIKHKFERTGRFRAFMEQAETYGRVVYVENIHPTSIRMMNILERNGYTFINNWPDCSAYKLPSGVDVNGLKTNWRTT